MNNNVNTVAEYLNNQPKNIRIILLKIRELILDTAPDSTESIGYGMPAYKLYGRPLVYFAAFKNHIGFYATPSGHTEFAQELSKYKRGKGSVQFPLDSEIPYKLIEEIVKFRIHENYERSKIIKKK